jgi:hypothetical protein
MYQWRRLNFRYLLRTHLVCRRLTVLNSFRSSDFRNLVLDQIRTIDLTRIIKIIGKLDIKEIKKVKSII